MSKLLRHAAVAAAALAAGTALYRSLVTVRVTLDLGVGRRTRALGPLSVDIAASPETVFAAAAAPYAGRPPSWRRSTSWSEPDRGSSRWVARQVLTTARCRFAT
jgi:hypothetical protein